jgi:3-hexulose-6-phosphate synthase/6-phospho-3-hexuloisomerase
VGTPLLKAEGLRAVRTLRARFPTTPIVCDAKTMDAGRLELEAAAKAGATIGTVLGVASDSTLLECVEAGRNYGIEVLVDLLGHPDPVARARYAESIGADYVNVHCPIDEQMRGGDPFDVLRQVAAAVSSVTVASRIGAATAPVGRGRSLIVIVEAIGARRQRRGSGRSRRVAGRHDRGAGTSDDDVRGSSSVSTPNVSGAHAAPSARPPCSPGVGWSAARSGAFGDWAEARRGDRPRGGGDVLVIDAGNVPPAVWGELATNSAVIRRLAGVVVFGAVRDTPDIRRLGLPVFARHVCAQAGEPKGLGEIGAPLRVDGIDVRAGDWIVGDDDGVSGRARGRAEVANRDGRCLVENRVRSEILSGRARSRAWTSKWEKQVLGGEGLERLPEGR